MDLSTDDFMRIAMDKVIDPQTRIKHQTASFGDFMDNLPSTIEDEFVQEKRETFVRPISGITSVDFGIRFTKIITQKPSIVEKGESKPLYPNEVLQSNRTYKSSVYSDVVLWNVKNKATPDGKSTPMPRQEVVLKQRMIGSIPIMVKSKDCLLYRMPPESQTALGEDPSDLGGYFIIEGNKKTMLTKKNSVKNVPQLQYIPTENMISCKFSSQPGDIYAASRFIQLNLIDDNKYLVFCLTLGRDLVLTVPFYVIYYLFEMVQDSNILDTILPDYDPDNIKHGMIMAMFRSNMTINYSGLKANLVEQHRLGDYGEQSKNVTNLVYQIASVISSNDKSMTARQYLVDNNENKAQTTNDIYALLDTRILVHIGDKPSDRKKKLSFLGSLIRETYECALGKSFTDRNSIENNSMHNPSPGLMTMLKTIFNITVAQNIIKAIIDAIRKDPTDFNMGNIFTQTINPNFMESIISKTLKAGNKLKIVINHTTNIASRINTVQHAPPSCIAAYSTLNSVTNDTGAMNNAANESMMRFRGVHASATGLLCPLHVTEGEKAGLASQMTPCAEITDITYSIPIKEMIERDVEHYDKMNEEGGGFYSQVIINGDPIGAYYDTRILTRKYRCLRRAGIIDRRVTIYYSPLNRGEMSIQTHIGRMCRPAVIVYRRPFSVKDTEYSTWPHLPVDANGIQYTMDTLPKIDKDLLGDNMQYIRFTKAHSKDLIAGKITIDDLVNEGILEWIGPGEYKNIIAAHDYTYFMEKRNQADYMFTHVDIPWQKVCMTIMTAPFAHCSQILRSAYQSKFSKQACGPPPFNLYNCFPSKLPVAYNSYRPIASTITDKIIPGGGAPVILAIMCAGDNQEDSLVCSQSFIQRAKMSVNVYSTISVEVETSREIRTPHPSTCSGCKSHDYSHLINGIPPIGTVIRNGMAVIGIVEISKDGKMTDRSVYHTKHNDIIIDGTVDQYKEGSTPIRKIRYYSVRPVEPGDKFGARSGCKGVLSRIVPDMMMPSTACGVVPELILNLASVPSRMILNQVIEGNMSYICSHYGVTADATMFRQYDEARFDSMAEKAGISPDGLQTLYDGMTGKKIRAKIYVNVNQYQRLDKMAEDTSAVTENPHIDIKTQQPYGSVNKNGGVRSGYMEIDTQIAHGNCGVLNDLMYRDSDGKFIHICDNCRNIAAVNIEENKYICKNKQCDGGSSFTRVETAQASIALLHYMAALGIKTLLNPERPMI
jgi:DNA-directed RNA polymerase II subunit RPB2